MSARAAGRADVAPPPRARRLQGADARRSCGRCARGVPAGQGRAASPDGRDRRGRGSRASARGSDRPRRRLARAPPGGGGRSARRRAGGRSAAAVRPGPRRRAGSPARAGRAGRARLAAGDLDGAEADLERLLDGSIEGRPAAAAWTDLARVALGARRESDALSRLDRAVAADPSYAEARWRRGTLRVTAGDESGAEDDLSAALRAGLPPAAAGQAWTHLARIARGRGDLAAARERARRARRASRDDPGSTRADRAGPG